MKKYMLLLGIIAVVILSVDAATAGVPTFFGVRASGVVPECELFLIQIAYGSYDEVYANYTIPNTDCRHAGNFSSALLWQTGASRAFFTITGKEIVQIDINEQEGSFDSITYSLPASMKAKRLFLDSVSPDARLVVQLVGSPLTVIIDPKTKTPVPSGQPSKIPEEVFAVRNGLGFAVVEEGTSILVKQYDLINPGANDKQWTLAELPVVVPGSTVVFGGCAEDDSTLIFHMAYFPDTLGTPNFTASVVFNLASGEVVDTAPVISLSIPQQPYTVLRPIIGMCVTDGAAGYTAASLRDPRNIVATSFVPAVSGAREYLSTRVSITSLALDDTASVLSMGLLASV